MNGKRWTLKDGTTIEITSMSELHLVNCASMLQNKYDLHKDPQSLMKLFDIVEELEYRKSEEWEGYTLIHIRQLIRKERLQNLSNIRLIPGTPVPAFTPKEMEYQPSKQVRTISKEEKLWQEIEAQMLPEGDKDKIIREDLYTEVDKVTRRMVLDPFTATKLPLLFFVNGFKPPHYKKVRITIEVLED